MGIWIDRVGSTERVKPGGAASLIGSKDTIYDFNTRHSTFEMSEGIQLEIHEATGYRSKTKKTHLDWRVGL